MAAAVILYQTDRVTLHHGDALDELHLLDTESLDLVVTDPPYGVEWRSNRRADRFELLEGDALTDREGIRQVLRESIRVVAQHRHLYVFGPTDVLDGLKISDTAELIWDKARPGMGDLAAPWAPAHERITFAVSQHRHAGKAGTSALPVRLRKGSVLRCSPPTGRKVRHPSEKPLELLRELIESSSRPDEVVLDPFAGVGSTGVAAVLAGRRAVLVEIDRRYADLAIDRLRRAEQLWAEGRAR